MHSPSSAALRHDVMRSDLPREVAAHKAFKQTALKIVCVVIFIMAVFSIAASVFYSLPAIAYVIGGYKLGQHLFLVKMAIAAGLIHSIISALSLTVLASTALAYVLKNRVSTLTP